MSVTSTAKGAPEQPNGAPGDATCEFTLVGGPSTGTLRIAVHTMQDRSKEYPGFTAACGASPRRLVGVGNEAIECFIRKDAIGMEQIIARVRQRAFVLSLSKSTSELAAGDEGTQAVLMKMQNTAEQIAGSLF